MARNYLRINNNKRRRALEILQFPHRLTSHKARSAMAARASAVRPLRRATEVVKIDNHHSAGMELRSDHFLVRSGDVPRSEARSLLEPQSAITARKSGKVRDMQVSLGPSVLSCKGELSYDKEKKFLDNWSMERMSEKEERSAFINRTKAAREARFPKQMDICRLLQIDQGTWKQYESRTPLPHRLIPRFIAACQVSYEWLLTGDGKGPEEIPRKIERRTSKPRRARAA